MGQITKEQFEAYEGIKKAGYCHMLKVGDVIRYAEEMFGVDLVRREVFEIAKNYKKYKEKFYENRC